MVLCPSYVPTNDITIFSSRVSIPRHQRPSTISELRFFSLSPYSRDLYTFAYGIWRKRNPQWDCGYMLGCFSFNLNFIPSIVQGLCGHDYFVEWGLLCDLDRSHNWGGLYDWGEFCRWMLARGSLPARTPSDPVKFPSEREPSPSPEDAGEAYRVKKTLQNLEMAKLLKPPDPSHTREQSDFCSSIAAVQRLSPLRLMSRRKIMVARMFLIRLSGFQKWCLGRIGPLTFQTLLGMTISLVKQIALR